MTDTETLRDRIKATLHMEANYGIGDMCSFYDRLGNAVMPLVEEFTRLAVETALAERSEAIAEAMEQGIPMHVTPADFVRDFGKDGA